MLGFTFLKNETAHSFLPDLSIFTYRWTCTQIFFTLLTSVLLISFPVSHMMLITSAVLYLPFKPWFLIWFLFYQAHVNFLLSSSVSPPLLFSSKVLRTKSYTFTLQHYEIYRTFFFFFPSDLAVFIFHWTTTLQTECETTHLNDWCFPSPEFLFLVYSHSHPPELRVSVGTCHGY